MGNYRRGGVDVAKDAVYFLSVDEYSEYDDPYAVYLPKETKIENKKTDLRLCRRTDRAGRLIVL